MINFRVYYTTLGTRKFLNWYAVSATECRQQLELLYSDDIPALNLRITPEVLAVRADK